MFEFRNKPNNDWVNFIYLLKISNKNSLVLFLVVINAKIFIILLVVFHLYRHFQNDEILVGHVIDVMRIVNMKHQMELVHQRLEIFRFILNQFIFWFFRTQNENVKIKFRLKIKCLYLSFSLCLIINIVIYCVSFLYSSYLVVSIRLGVINVLKLLFPFFFVIFGNW
jgi:hypothetical protein